MISVIRQLGGNSDYGRFGFLKPVNRSTGPLMGTTAQYRW